MSPRGVSGPARAVSAKARALASASLSAAPTVLRRARPRAVVGTQRLGTGEQLFHALRRHTATNVVRVLAIEGRLDVHDLEHALLVLQARHPLLSAHIEDGSRPYFVYGCAPPPRVIERVRRDDQHWHELLEEVLCTPIARRPGPLLELTYVHAPGQRRAELIVAAEHTICDGVSLNQLCSELVELCGAEPPGRPARAITPVLDALVPAFSPRKHVLGVGVVFARFFRIALQRRLLERRSAAVASAHTWAELTREQTRALVETARSQRTTVTGALMAAVLRAVRELRADDLPLAISVPINMRTRLPGPKLEPGDLGNYTSVAYLQSRAHGSTWELARGLKLALDDVAQSEGLLAAVPLVYRVGRKFVRAGKPPLAHAMVSNSGLVPIAAASASFQVTGIYSATSAPMLSADYSLFCNTLHGRLCLNLVFSESVVSRGQAARVLARVTELLLADVSVPASSTGSAP